MSERVDTVIVGGGAMGLAAAWQLARRGRQVTLLERFTIGNLYGASHGTTRNFNQAYSDPGYVAMVGEAERLWQELEDESGEHLLEMTGIVNHGVNPGFDAVHSALASAGIPSEFLSVEEAGRRWPGIKFDTRVLFAPRSGRLRAAEALAALQRVAAAHGAEIRLGVQVTGVTIVDGDRVRIDTTDGEFSARRAVITAGAWSKALVGGIVSLPRLVVTQEQPAHFAEREPGLEWPGFNHSPDPSEANHDFWLSPVYGMRTPGEGIKVGWHGAGPVTDPDHRSFTSEPQQLAALQRYVREWLPGADPERFVEISCSYTSTPDANFVLKRSGPLTVGAGFSGHGFKFTPAVGRILADLSDGRDSAPVLGTVPF